MPMYEYRCQSCGVIVEAIQSFSAAPLTTCKSCGGDLKKLISRSAFHLKGGGWYSDHYGLKESSDKSADNANKTGAPEAPKSSSESTKTAEAAKSTASSSPEPSSSAKSESSSGSSSESSSGAKKESSSESSKPVSTESKGSTVAA